MSTNTFQRRYARLFAATAIVALVTTLCFQSQAALTAVGLSLLYAAGNVLLAVFSGSAALNGAILALGVGLTHMRFWGPAKWDGRKFSVPGQPSLAKWSEWVGGVGALGFIFLMVSLFFYAAERPALDSVLCLISLQVVVTTLAHKARMNDIAMSIPDGEKYMQGGDFAGEYVVLGVGGVAAAAGVMRLLEVSGHGPLGGGLGVVAYAAAAFGVWHLTRLPYAVPDPADTVDATPAHA